MGYTVSSLNLQDNDPEWDSPGSSSDCPEFGKFDTEIKTAIKNLGGAVFPKLNWSSPKVLILCIAFRNTVGWHVQLKVNFSKLNCCYVNNTHLSFNRILFGYLVAIPSSVLQLQTYAYS